MTFSAAFLVLSESNIFLLKHLFLSFFSFSFFKLNSPNLLHFLSPLETDCIIYSFSSPVFEYILFLISYFLFSVFCSGSLGLTLPRKAYIGYLRYPKEFKKTQFQYKTNKQTKTTQKQTNKQKSNQLQHALTLQDIILKSKFIRIFHLKIHNCRHFRPCISQSPS